MDHLRLFSLRPSMHVGFGRRFVPRARLLGCGLALLGALSLPVGSRAGQAEPVEDRKARLEVEKLELEVAALRRDRETASSWIVVVGGLLAGIAGAGASVWVARRARLGELDQALHEKRLEEYPALTSTTAPLALYFPSDEAGAASLGPDACRTMGRGMSVWYFAGGGLLMSREARDAYFLLARALTRAARAADLRVPRFREDAEAISLEQVRAYRKALGLRRVADARTVERWCFGDDGRGAELPHRFADYVLLQWLSSALRTALAGDLRSRRRPS